MSITAFAAPILLLTSLPEGGAAANVVPAQVEAADPAGVPDAAAQNQSDKVSPEPSSGSEIVVTAAPGAENADPLESVNVKAYDTVQSVDMAVTGPIAMKYKRTVPGSVRRGARNFFGNLQEPIVFLNYLLQLKPGKAAETFARFGINSTIGLAGVFDRAKEAPFNLPRRNNGFAYTLGYYGVKPGAFLYLPLIGPTTVRDIAGRLVDLSVLPYAVGKPFSDPLYAIPTTTLRLLDERAEADEDIQAVRTGDNDPYTEMKSQYLRTRQAEIDALHGK